MQQKQTIRFDFHPRLIEKGLHAVEKDEGGKKKRYLIGVSSGVAVDGHKERMSKNAISSFMTQAASGDVLLYPDVHGIKATDDVGRLVKAEVLDNGDWYTEYCLYDGSEGAQPYQVQKANVLWAQACALPPYQKARQKGFSIEGIVPEGCIKADETGRKIIDDVQLDGVVVVPRPAYQTSVAMAVYKALGERPPMNEGKVLKSLFVELFQKNEAEKNFYSVRWDMQAALDEAIQRVMKSPDIADKRAVVDEILLEFAARYADLIMQSAALFQVEETGEAETMAKSILAEKGAPREKLFKALHHEMTRLYKQIKETT